MGKTFERVCRQRHALSNARRWKESAHWQLSATCTQSECRQDVRQSLPSVPPTVASCGMLASTILRHQTPAGVGSTGAQVVSVRVAKL